MWAARRFFGIVELVEMMARHLPLRDVLVVSQVNATAAGGVRYSRELNRRLAYSEVIAGEWQAGRFWEYNVNHRTWWLFRMSVDNNMTIILLREWEEEFWFFVTRDGARPIMMLEQAAFKLLEYNEPTSTIMLQWSSQSGTMLYAAIHTTPNQGLFRYLATFYGEELFEDTRTTTPSPQWEITTVATSTGRRRVAELAGRRPRSPPPAAHDVGPGDDIESRDGKDTPRSTGAMTSSQDPT
ncbi:hypothetical protein Tdes44962_MAKER01746 [Teratosphaeria destructans]|uniref:Uncharacterized protein n=1 Tax=Teratosphaeria destructans TaxID=418781 RepID=A0A9W7SXX7_9PEZI|nr:hypothetical protein Tdes44962_MAKER01746 [Teratosphaeria destructans]